MKTIYKNLIHLLFLLPFFVVGCDDEAAGKLSPINLERAESTVGAEGGIVTVRTERPDWWLEGVTEIHDGEKMPYRNNGYEEINGINTPYPEKHATVYSIQKKRGISDCLRHRTEHDGKGTRRGGTHRGHFVNHDAYPGDANGGIKLFIFLHARQQIYEQMGCLACFSPTLSSFWKMYIIKMIAKWLFCYQN